MAASRTFQSRVKQKVEPKPEDEIKIRITLDTVDDDTGEVTFSEAYTFSRPDDGRLMLMIASYGSAGTPFDQASETLATIKSMLDPIEYAKLRQRLDGPRSKRIEPEVLAELLIALVEEWSEGFPTQPSSDSLEAPRSTGGRSTGRSPGKGSTRSTSASRAS